MATNDNNQERGDSQWDRLDVAETIFPLGTVVVTRAAYHTVPLEDIQRAIVRHARGDWGEVCMEDRAQNESALFFRRRLFSSYLASDGTCFWIITEANRSVTTVLLQDEYPL